jgi:hypothetical protein
MDMRLSSGVSKDVPFVFCSQSSFTFTRRHIYCHLQSIPALHCLFQRINKALTRIYKRHLLLHQSCHNTIHNSACRQAKSQLQCRFWKLHQIKMLSPYLNSEITNKTAVTLTENALQYSELLSKKGYTQI